MRLVAENGKYVRAESGGGLDGTLRPDALVASQNYQTGWSHLRVEPQPDGTLRIAVPTGHYITAERGGGGVLSTNRSMPGPLESFRFVPVKTAPGQPKQVLIACQDGAHLWRLHDGDTPVIDASGIPGMPGTRFIVHDHEVVVDEL